MRREVVSPCCSGIPGLTPLWCRVWEKCFWVSSHISGFSGHPAFQGIVCGRFLLVHSAPEESLVHVKLSRLCAAPSLRAHPYQHRSDRGPLAQFPKTVFRSLAQLSGYASAAETENGSHSSYLPVRRYCNCSSRGDLTDPHQQCSICWGGFLACFC
jgi:hypothetical protein